MALKQILTNAQAFEFITDKGVRLPFDGVAKNWSDDHGQDIASHKILKRSGVIHQVPGNPPPMFTFDCVFLGANVTTRYRDTTEALDASPLGQLVHPRLGMMRAANKGMKAKEDPGAEIDVILFTIMFERSGLRPVQSLSAQGHAVAATQTAQSLTPAVSARAPQALAKVVTLQSYVGVFEQQIAALVSGDSVVATLRAALTQVQAQAELVAGTIGQNPVLYDMVGLARLAAGQCLASYNVAVQNRPPVVTRTVQGTMGLGRFCQILYGSLAREQQAEIELLNRIARPYSLPDQLTLLVPDPVVILAARR